MKYYGGDDNGDIDNIDIDTKGRISLLETCLDVYDLDGSKWSVNVQSLSGAIAILYVYYAILKPHECLMGLVLPHVHLMDIRLIQKKISAVSAYFKPVSCRLDEKTDRIKILGSVLITSHGQVLIWGGEDVSRNCLQWQNIKELSLNFLDKLDELNIKYNAMITDSASQNQAASLVVSSQKAIQIISFLNRSVYFMAKLRDEQKFKYNKYFALLLPCATCWNSHYHCYSNACFKICSSEFEADDNYTGNDENDIEMPLEMCRIIANEDWWKDIKKLEKLLLPFCGALNKLQTDNACLHDMWKEYPDQNLSARMTIRLEKHWQIWEQPLLLLSFILHPEYYDKIFLQDNTSISIANLSEWMIYYFCVWFKKVPDTLLGELQNYHRQNFPFHNISLKQFNDGVLGFWDFVSAYTPDLNIFSTKYLQYA
ncbi:11937_t:CDS:2 [Entrophospora sp. SA101]|nr:11937_t:CDS:2 [Entrophospora sp. SA101]